MLVGKNYKYQVCQNAIRFNSDLVEVDEDDSRFVADCQAKMDGALTHAAQVPSQPQSQTLRHIHTPIEN